MADARKKARSPYQRYGKSPWKYDHQSCSHTNSTYQQVDGWKGFVCTRCNIIVEPAPRRFSAEAA